jgi:hypothetical protein
MTKQPTPATIAERVAALRARRSREGLVRLEVWALPEHHEAIKAYVAKLNKKTARSN